jgi:hypothetical protein
VKFNQLTKKKLKNFDQTPKLTENFYQLKMSSEIRSSDRFPYLLFGIYYIVLIKFQENQMWQRESWL